MRDLVLRLRALFRRRRVEQDLDDELAFHLACEERKLIERGMDPAAARIEAGKRFGSVALAADECRDARGTAFVDNTSRDIAYALRSFRHAPLAAATIVLTIGLGLGLVTVVFNFYSAWFLQADAVRNPGELYAVDRPPTPGAGVWIPFQRSEFEALRRETDVFTDAVATLIDVGTRIDGRPANATLVSGTYFQVLGTTPALGRTLLPPDDEGMVGRPVLVLSHRGWVRLFGSDPAIVGRRASINGTDYEIVGVMPPAFRGLGSGRPDYWAPLGRYFEARNVTPGTEIQVSEVIGRLKPGVEPARAQAALTAWATARPELQRRDGHQAYVRLTPGGRFEPDSVRGLKTFSPLFIAFALVLLIGCANVANLLLARGVARQREIGVRLALGASRRRIVRQLLTENLLLSLAAAASGFVIARLLLEIALGVLLTTMPPEFAEGLYVMVPGAGGGVAVFLLAGAVGATILFGFMPALAATRIELVRTMRGEVVQDARPGRARGALIAVQVGASALLLICAAVFLRSAATAASHDPGLRTHDIVTIDPRNEPRRPALLHELVAQGEVAAVAASSPGPMGILNNATAHSSGSREDVVAYQLVSPEYFALLDIDIIRGRGFSAAERSPDAGVVVVSERVVRELWPEGNPVGELVRLEPWKQPESWRRQVLPARAYTVIGVARDVGSRLRILGREFAHTGVYLPTDATAAGTVLTARVHGDPAKARQVLLERLTRVDPSLGDIVTLRTMAGIEAYIMRAAFWTTAAIGFLALALTLSGLFSVLTYLTEQRRREFGVRMALGATGRDISRLVVRQSAWPVGLGLITGGALATALAAGLLALPAAGHFGAVVQVRDPVPYIAGLSVIAAACLLAALLPARRAARLDPIATLRQE